MIKTFWMETCESNKAGPPMSHDGHAVWLDTGYILKGEMKGKKS
jgi:hypothetical protein